MIRVKIASFNKSQYLITALFFAIILNSCASLSSLDKAQDDFNKAAEMENAALLQQTIYVASPPQNSDYYYDSAYKEVTKALEKEPQLKKLDVYVDALLIKALCEWKLPKYENKNAKNSARLALDYMGDKAAEDRPRDYAVLRALGALIGIEEMNVHQDSFFKVSDISPQDAKEEFDNISANIQQNIKDLNDISEKITKKHDVQTYLIMCELSALKVWEDALDSAYYSIEENPENDEWYHDQKVVQREVIKKSVVVLKERIGETNSVYLYWKKLFALSNN